MLNPVIPIDDAPAIVIHREKWTAIIPAAGYGSRLGHDKPKILYPLAGRPILDWLLDALDPVCAKYVLALSPDGEALVEPHARRILGDRLQVVVQETPTGMGDAVLLGEGLVDTEFSLIVWGDQATLRKETILACAALHEARPHATLTFPTAIKNDAYIDFERDADERLLRVLQKREGESVRESGENDCGLFLFTTGVLFPTLRESFRTGEGRGRKTREANLLQVLPMFERGPGSVVTLRINDPSETLGVNTPEDADRVEALLLERTHPGQPDRITNAKSAKQVRTLSIVIPAYNEEAFIGALLEKLQAIPTEQYGFEKEIIVVDDGSNDRTDDIAGSFTDVRVIRQKNQGKGAAVQRGVREATGAFVLVQDADLEYDPDDIPSMLQAIGSDASTAIYGSRLLGILRDFGARLPFPGRAPNQSLAPWLMNRILTIMTAVLYRRRITDMLTGYKLYPMKFLREINVKTAGFETDHELTAKLIRQGYSIREVPVTYSPRSVKEGKKIRAIDGVVAVWTLLRFWRAG